MRLRIERSGPGGGDTVSGPSHFRRPDKAVSKRKLAPAKTRAPLWNEERRQTFLDTLAECSNVAASERAAGMMPGSAYRERRRSVDFCAAWYEALCEGYTRLELVLLERALGGVVARTTKNEKGEEVKEQFSDRLTIPIGA